ncbi:MAG: nucleotidyltransferase domain-containing protein [Candidatus Marinimicrobia bacterium]|nr:nucleotidyltransferase domain-containing protein [Candidatus Neomarinimicrobiota bacterium]
MIMLQKREINMITDYFKDKPVLRAYLFGSQVRNEADVDSDIDILVELDYSQPIGLKYIKMQNELREILKSKVDLLSDNAVSKYIRPIIDHEKRLIYEK